jgi:hypothetical protein
MTIVCEIAFAISANKPLPQADFSAGRHWASLPGLAAIDVYSPIAETVADPYVNDGAAPAGLAMLAFASAEALDDAVRAAAFSAAIAALPDGTAISCTAMERIDYAVGGATEAAPLVAPFSYVVRYYKPADNEAQFVRNYLDGHPPLLARLPNIRNVLCYVPFARQPGGLQAADYLIGNEVAFDDIAAFNTAMASPVRHELRAHFNQLPGFNGKNTHYPMVRRRLFG